MKTFTLHLESATEYQAIDRVLSYIGEDASGGFGILAGHERMMTVQGLGLARFRRVEEDWQYLALPGAVLYFAGEHLHLSTRRYLLDRDRGRLCGALREGLLEEEEALAGMKKSLRRLEEEMFKRLIGTRPAPGL
jgi:F-type H+-transporting ATPase subunit epsilon